MKSILQELYDGKINPSERGAVTATDHQPLNQKISDEKEFFKGMLSPENYERLEKLETLYTNASDMEDFEAFSYGFKLAVLLVFEVFGSKNELVSGN